MNRARRTVPLYLLIGLTLSPYRLLAQEMDHSKMHMPASPEASPSPQPRIEAAEEKAIDHSKMGHGMGADSDGPMPMDHAAMNHGDEAAAPSQPRTPIPVVTDADRAAAAPPLGGHPPHDNSIQQYVLLDRLEGWDADPGAGTAWAVQGWLGTDLDRLWLRSEGERVDGHTESADVEVLYGRSVARWWDVVAGIRHDFAPGGSQDFAAIGVMGLAPYLFEVQATGYIGQSGQTAARIEVEYEMLLTNRLILQPVLEADFYGRNDPQRGIGSGLSTAEAGLRLRYEISRQFAPYLGIVHERAFGRTADFREEEGEDASDTRVVAGFRLWF